MEQKYTSTPENRKIDVSIFGGDFLGFNRTKGVDIFGRTRPAVDWINAQRKQQLWLYGKANLTAPKTECLSMDEYGNKKYGVNFATADYLGLAHHPAAREEAKKVMDEYGIGSGGSPLAFGVSKYYLQLEKELAEFWQMKKIIIFSTGWMAGYGVVKGLVREHDNIVMDQLSHNCLIEGANAATKKIHKVTHLSIEAHEQKIKELRETDPDNGIFVITEGLFSMDSDTIDLNALQQICKKYKAFMLIDSCHDFGCMGENGRGTFELQNLKDRSNVVILATGSKSFSTNVGFAGCDDPYVVEYLKVFASPFMFCNSISPIQAATCLANLNIIRGEEGKSRRKQGYENSVYLREQFEKNGFKCLGYPSPIIPVMIGSEILSRITARLMLDEGISSNQIEFPVVAMGQSRFRVVVQPIHTKEQMDTFVESLVRCCKRAKEICKKDIDPDIYSMLGIDEPIQSKL